MKYIFILFIYSFIANAEEIACSDQSCSFTSGIDDYYHLEQSDNHLITINDYFEESISVIKPLGEDPKNLKVSVKFTDNNQDVNFNIGSMSEGIKASDVIFFTNHLNNLTVSANGYNGVPQELASEICAIKIKNGDYGQTVLNNFNSRRSGGLSDQYCVAQDIDDIKNLSFSCDDNSYNEFTSTFDVERWKERQECAGGQTVNMCVERKVQLVCSWASVGSTTCCNSTGSTYQPPGSGWACDANACSPSEQKTGWVKVQSTIVTETEYQSVSNNKTDQQICDYYFFRDRSPDKEEENGNVGFGRAADSIDYNGNSTNGCSGGGDDTCNRNLLDFHIPNSILSSRIIDVNVVPGYIYTHTGSDNETAIRSNGSKFFNDNDFRVQLYNDLKSRKVNLGAMTGNGRCGFDRFNAPENISDDLIISSETRGYKLQCTQLNDLNRVRCEFGAGRLSSDDDDCGQGRGSTGSDAGVTYIAFIEYVVVDQYGYIHTVIQAGLLQVP